MNYISNSDRFGPVLGEAAAFFRSIALEIDALPGSIEKYYSHPVINGLVFEEKQTCGERIRLYEALGYGDAGVLLSCPGPSLAGVIMDEIGDQRQRDFFYQYLRAEKACTFLAVTEPAYGSNLSAINTRLTLDQTTQLNHVLDGEKWLVGHGATGMIGVAIVRTNEGPLGIRALLLTPDQLQKKSIKRMLLPMTGLKGARLGRIHFDKHEVDADHLLGSHLPATQRGMMALIKTFNKMRPCIGALAIGTAQALVDYSYMSGLPLNLSQKYKLKTLSYAISITRELLYLAGQRVEQNPYDAGFSSLAKVKATKVAEEAAEAVFDIVGKRCFIEHPLIEKWCRDTGGFEYMEGTQHIHKINTFNAFRNDSIQFG